MSMWIVLPVEFAEWGWLFGFALVSLALVALAVLADALYEGYRQRVRLRRELLARTGPGAEVEDQGKKAA